jgi:ABC-type sugar transport system ATPase subunit
MAKQAVMSTKSQEDGNSFFGADFLQVQNVTKRFGHTTALDGLSLELSEGECLVVLGPSGAGKTTLLKVLSGLEKLDSGLIHFKGRLINNLEPCDRNMAMVFETYALYPHLSVYENISSPLRVLRMSSEEINRRASEIAKMLGIDPYLNRKPGFLSGGQRQRVALGRALAKPADLYLLDEPIAHLDAKLRHQMIGEFQRLRESLKIALIYVTHDWLEAMSLGNHIMVLNKGCVDQYGSPVEIFKSPRNTFVAQMVGDPPMNLISGEIVNRSNGSFFRSGSFERELPTRVEAGPITLGIRPPKIRLGHESNKDTAAEVYSSGKHGMKSVVSLKVDGAVIKAELAETVKLQIGQRVPVRFELEDACLFDGSNNLIRVLQGTSNNG